MYSIKIENQKEIEINEELTADTSDIIIPHDIKFLRIVWCDNANLIRGKAVYIDSCEDLSFLCGDF